jgi:hypothetical protein
MSENYDGYDDEYDVELPSEEETMTEATPTRNLSIVRFPEGAHRSASGLPKFEGQDVDFARLKLTSASDLEVNDEAHHIDDIVRLQVEGRVVRVDHVVDERTGHLKRVHTVKVSEAIELTWDDSVDKL